MALGFYLAQVCTSYITSSSLSVFWFLPKISELIDAAFETCGVFNWKVPVSKLASPGEHIVSN